MFLLYPMYERSKMIRKATQLASPLLHPISELTLPRNALFHYLPTSKEDIGPDVTNPIYKTIKKPIQMYSPLVLTEAYGNPRKIAFEANSPIRKFLVKNRRFRKLIDLKVIPKDDRTLTVINYSLIPKSYKYMKTLYSEYEKFQDIMLTVMKQINDIAKISNKNQFITIGVPKILPAVSRLQNSSKRIDVNSVKIFNTDEGRMLLELWKFLNEEPTESIFSKIDKKNYRYVNFIISNGKEWLALNMAKLYYWSRSAVNELMNDDNIENKKEVKSDTVVYNNLQLQKYLLRMYMILNSSQSVSNIDADKSIERKIIEDRPIDRRVNDEGGDDFENTTDPTDDEDNEDSDEDPDDGNFFEEEDLGYDLKEEEYEDDLSEDSKYSIKTGIKTKDKKKKKKEELVAEVEVVSEAANKIIDDDLKELEKINDQILKENDEEDINTEDIEEQKELDYEGKLKKSINSMSAKGLITAAEQRRLIKLTEKYNKLESPFNEDMLLKDYVVIDEKDKKIDTEKVVSDNIVVFDKKLAYSSLKESQETYVKKILPKHTLKVLSSIQNAGIIVNDIKVDTTHSYQGDIDNYVVKVTPVEGSPSTFRFPLPQVKEDGTYEINGVRYLLRKQKVDNPIRKVGDNRVALSSYYGKFFVYRSRKQANDYGQWLRNEVLTLGYDEQAKNIKDVKASNVFNNTVKSPRSISELSKGIKEFTVMSMDNENFTFYLSLPDDVNKYDKKKTEINITKGFTPIAKSDKGNIIYFKDDGFYLIKNDKIVDLGSLEDILGLDLTNAPIEYVELKINGSYLPIGVLLAYEYGFDNLIKHLGISVERYPSNQRLGLGKDKVVIRFEDERIVYDRKDPYAALLLNGFHEYRQVIRDYTVSEFNKKNVYQRVFDFKFDATRVLREYELAKQMFVDPITEEVLKELNQPTNFIDILKYASQLLVHDYHKDSMDPTEMRIRGYEKLPGLVYKELVSAMRVHNARPMKKRHIIDFKPYAILQALGMDSSVVVVKDINPIENLKQIEEVTLIGTGGRDKDSLKAFDSRVYHDNDVGLISEATKDSGDVGITTYMPPNPQIENYLGLPKEGKEITTSSVFSTSALSSPAIDRDDYSITV